MKEELNIVKIGGNVINHESGLNQFLIDFSSISTEKLLVHGGGKIATEIGEQMGIKATMVEGRRVTDFETLKLVTMVYAGLVNKTIVSKLQSKNCNAVGLTGADGNLILSEMRSNDEIDFGFVGDIKKINTTYLIEMLDNGIVPVIAPITHDGEGNVLNTNADGIASEIAVSLINMYDVKLNYCFEFNGVLRDINDKNSVIEKLEYLEYLDLRNEGVISKGMIPKLDNCYKALQAGVKEIRICNSNDISDIINNNTVKGTLLYNN